VTLLLQQPRSPARILLDGNLHSPAGDGPESRRGLTHWHRQAPAARRAQGRLFQARLLQCLDAELAPSAKLVSWVLSEPFIPKRWSLFERRYRQEMRPPVRRRIITLLAGLSSQTNFSLGCYCQDEARCHRSALRQLLLEHGAKLA
jgi:uncharacterized protein YeaO (DUF488 family)